MAGGISTYPELPQVDRGWTRTAATDQLFESVPGRRIPPTLLVSLHWGSWGLSQVTPKTGWNSLRSNMLTSSPTAPRNFTYHPVNRVAVWTRSSQVPADLESDAHDDRVRRRTRVHDWICDWILSWRWGATGGEGWIGRWLVKGSMYSWF
jgi:hypothetical protein